MNSIRKLISLFSRREKLQLIPLTVAVFIMSVLDVAGIGSLGPFVAVIADPAVIERQPSLAAAYDLLGFETTRGFLIALGAGVFAIIAIGTAFKMLVLYAIFRYVGNRRYTLGMRLFRQYLYQPYSYYLDHNTTELSKNLLAEVNQVINGVLRPGMEVFTHGTLALAILVFLLVINPVVGLAAGGVFGLIYGVLYAFVRPRLRYYGQELRESNRLRFKATSEAFGAIKDVKILGQESAFADKFAHGAWRFSRTQAAKQILSQLPNHAMRAMSVAFAISLVLVLLLIGGSITAVIPLIAVYAYAVQRLIPELQKVFRGVSQIRYYAHTVDALYHDMTEMPVTPPRSDKKASRQKPEIMSFKHSIQCRDLSFSYTSSAAPVLNSVDLEIYKNTTVGFVGTTGCGKTTLVDLLMGLLEPTSGEILVDDRPLQSPSRASFRSWQRNFGYVPQHIYLSDDTVAANIAFGVADELRNLESVERAASVANLHNFVTNELPNGYETVVGERGIRLSGGQRQRVGIARALYHNPQILVMDEATSALDTMTEEAVMDAIHTLMHTKTIILIAHRITTVQECDLICLIERGRIVAQGGYDDLLRSSRSFRSMAKVSTAS